MGKSLYGKTIGFRCSSEEIVLLDAYGESRNIKKRGNIAKHIVMKVLSGGLSPSAQAPIATPAKVGVLEQPQTTLHVETPNPMLAKQVDRFMMGGKSPIIEGLLSIDESSFNHSILVGNKGGIAFLIPRTTHDIRSGGNGRGQER